MATQLSTDKMRQIIKRFVRKHITEQDLDRDIDLEFGGFDFKDNIEELYKLNDEVIDKLNPTELLRVTMLLELIRKKKLHKTDKEDFIVWKVSGFCWNRKKQLVMFNER